MEYTKDEQIINKLSNYLNRNISYIRSKRVNKPIENDYFYVCIGYENALRDVKEYLDILKKDITK